MKRLLFIILGIIFITGCGEAIPKPDPSPPPDLRPRLEVPPPPTNPTYTESCSDLPERAELENAEANVYEIWLACLIKNHPEQNRTTMSYHPDLGEVARMRADDLAVNGIEWDGHTDSHGYGPNYYICLAGYDSPYCSMSPPTANAAESLGGGEDSQGILNGWLGSYGHRIHLLGEHENFVSQSYYGVGHAYATDPPDYVHGGSVWIFLTADPPLDETTDEFGTLETHVFFVTHSPLDTAME
jgi:uncharacterized protein YkwD